MPGIYLLKGTVKHYDWGGNSFIPALLQMDNNDKKPFAEYWLGVHPNDECVVELNSGNYRLLREYINENSSVLGDEVRKRFGNLPYLLKILDVKDMLSIQVHPSKKMAEKEFAKENKEDIPLNSPERNYKDDNHKPELMVALSDFWLLHGFKPKEKLINILQTVPELKLLILVFERFGYEGLYKTVMEMPQQEVNNILEPLVSRIIPLYKKGKLDKSQENFWAARAALTFHHNAKPDSYRIDRGIFSVYFFNVLHLKKGQGIFQDAGVPHAYLEGQNVEIMANSDNVLRGGLTNKHIDVKELLKHVKCEETEANILTGDKIQNEIVYKTPAPDFQLSSFHLQKGQQVSVSADCAEIFLLTNGHIEIKDGDKTVSLQPGSPSAVVFAEQKATLSALENSTVFRASVPINKSE